MGVKTYYKDMMDGWTCLLGIRHVRVKTELHVQIQFYV
jgi:hypothetical protein